MQPNKKLNPGHYLQFKGNGFYIDDVGSKADNFTGILIEIFWSTIEPIENQYVFDYLKYCLQWAKENNKQLFIMLVDRDFSNVGSKTKILPKWLVDQNLTTTFNSNKGCIAKIWLESVNRKRINLITAILNAFDSDPFLEGIILQETALGGISPVTNKDYSNSIYTQQIVTLYKELGKTKRVTSLFQSINWLGGFKDSYLDQIAEVIKDSKVGGLTNPDSVPWQKDEKPMYGVFKKYANTIPLIMGGDTSQLDKPNGEYYTTFTDLVLQQYKMSVQHSANYILWNSNFTSKEATGKTVSIEYLICVNALVRDPVNTPNSTIPQIMLEENYLIKDWFSDLEKLIEKGKALL